MRTPLLTLISLLVTSAAVAAEALRLPPAERPQAGTTTAPLKGAAGKARAGSCASYGPRFVMVEGTGTCVKIGGSISIDTTVRR
ncbi:hypothetical protein XH83_18310 [Bradyrhizobium sp. CCBAU 53351]|uniref:hypothetical protein n=1 Tax=Bradyrhizobium sp. CCBAU 53351 TaxID=1325114 RepID=UPI0018878CEE|nr:hypothetical protein [Bradyrhizobium sp. CCBAU 53351]QOZ77231.1 hypothetical protein XH83_18310 [Bradyrhizobium sp. CCBAU 53351]